MQIACRCERPLHEATIQKIAQSCQVEFGQVVTVRDLETIYQVPLLLEEQGLLSRLRETLMLDQLTLLPTLVDNGSNLWEQWKKTVVLKPHLEPVNIALVGKYTALRDSKHLLMLFIPPFGKFRRQLSTGKSSLQESCSQDMTYKSRNTHKVTITNWGCRRLPFCGQGFRAFSYAMQP